MTGVVVHVTSPEPGDWDRALGNLSNLLAAEGLGVGPDVVAVVVHGGALAMVLAGSPVAGAVEASLETGVSVRACANTLAGRGEDASALLDGVEVVSSGVAEVVGLQRAGWAYLKLP